MIDWAGQIHFEDVAVGDELDTIEIPVTLQRLVMEAGANRDFSLIHHDRDVARATGAPDAYANTFFIVGMFERLLREWMGLEGRLNRISRLRGTPTSSRAIRPPGRTTRASSSKNAGNSVRLRSAKPQVTPSTEPPGAGRRRMSVWTRGAPERSAASIPKLRSIDSGT